MKLELMLGENKRVPAIDPNEVGIFAAHLLASDDLSLYDRKKLVLVGPKAVSGREVVDLVEKHAGTKVDEVVFNSVLILDYLDETKYPKNMLSAMRHAIRLAFADGNEAVTSKTTSKEVLGLYAPRNSAADLLEESLARMEK